MICVLIKLSAKMAGLSCLVDQVSILSWLCATLYALLPGRSCRREQLLQYNFSTMVYYVVLTCAKTVMFPSRYDCMSSLLPITSFQRNSAWIPLSKMMIRTIINKVANNQTEDVISPGKLPSLALEANVNGCILESKGINWIAATDK